MNSRRRLAAGVAVIAALLGAVARGESRGADHPGHAPGAVHFPVSCSERAQAEFDQAVALLHHMTYPQAREAFRQVAATDPRCAMAHWGIAMTLFQPLCSRPSLKEAERYLAGRR